MVTKHGEISQSETQRIRADQEECQFGHDRRRTDRAGQFGRETGSQPFSFGRVDRTGTDSPVGSGDDPLGGTVQQLITETREEINEIEARGEKLRQRLTSLEELSERLKENPVVQ